MKAITYQSETDTFSLSELPQPQVQSDFDVVIRVNAVGLNPVDCKINLWHPMVEGMSDTFVGGLDVSGTIVELGSAVKDWRVGDRVLYHGNMRRFNGGFAEYAVQDSRTLINHPDVPAEVAAATPCAGWTAYRALFDKVDISRCRSLFIAGGAGGVGSFALQLAKHAGVETIITSASSTKHDYVRSLGATHVIDYREQDVIQQVADITGGEGVEVALDCVGGDNDKISAAVLAFEGHLIELVKVLEPSQYDNAFLRGLSFHQLSLGSGHVNGERARQALVTAGEAFSALLEQGHIQVIELKSIPLEMIGEQLMQMRDQRTKGKIVAIVAD
ncbi:zinc-binding dehydrogenase [Vibrio sp. LaRot3]|uniref:zinc-binding dehydrogenase n=1 Tax=Vibrio sp. LaRot3 TaxID=2998829 RepID=UPI0022CE356C|nr:zinc-binding dehydrogenase [Vibrio sp. LaRot3]MDA0149815.1 zinc-binding dehydrogenase [Vibrio sp. LaRot3]